MLNLFVASKNISLLSGAKTVFRQEGAGPKNIKYKFHFAPKLLSICINQKYSMGIGSVHNFFIKSKLNLGVEPTAVGELGDLLAK